MRTALQSLTPGVRVYYLAILGLKAVKHLAQRLDAAGVNVSDASGNGGVQGGEPSLRSCSSRTPSRIASLFEL
jgi:hypothetical protein